MKMQSIYLSLLTLGISSLPSYAQELEDLIVPVTGLERAEAVRKSELSLREKLYRVNNYRIVKINDKLLYGEKKFRISLLQGDELIVETIAVEQSAPGAITWQGIIVPNTQARYRITSQPVDEMPSPEADRLYKDLFGISVDMMEWDRNNRTGENRLVMYGSQSQNATFDSTNWVDFSPNAFRTVQARFTAIGTDPRGADKVYRIEHLEGNEEFHVLYQESQEIADSMRIDAPYDETSPKGRRDKEIQDEYQKFLDAIREEKAAKKNSSEGDL